MPLDPGRRADLLAAKLRAVVADRWPAADLTPDRHRRNFPHGAALAEGTRGWVLAGGDDASRSLGPALFWAHRHGIDDLHVLADDPVAGATLARRAGEFAGPPASPAITVWTVDGRALVETAAAPVPAPPASSLDDLPPEVAAFERTLRAAGAEPVVEHGVLVGEVLGLEVARVITGGGEPSLEVGVGKHDRHAQSLVHGERSRAEALARAIQFVGAHRRAGAEPHPLNRLARERWLRSILLERPAVVGAARLRPVSSPVLRDDLRVSAPAPAIGEGADGRPVVVVCSTGIDLDLVPAAADVRLASGVPDARLVLVVPPRDDHPAIRRLAAGLRHRAEVQAVRLIAFPGERE